MSVSKVPGTTPSNVSTTKRPRAGSRPDTGPQDTVKLGGATDPIERVDNLIARLRQGEIKYAPEIAVKIRPQELDLGNFPCHKYILTNTGPVDDRTLATEIVPRGEKSRYKNSLTEESKLTAKENAKDLKDRVKSIRKQTNEIYAQQTESVMVIAEGDNAAGKDGIIGHAFNLNPMTTSGQHAFKAANAEEKQHEPNWRIMKYLAGPGQVGFHNRSAYGDVAFAAKTETEKRQRTAEIKEMEYGLTMGLPMTSEGRIALPDKTGKIDPSAIQRPPMRFMKVVVIASAPEQAARLADRLEDPAKLYKISESDLEGHPNHHEVQSALASAMAAASTPWAPTYFIPNDNKPMGQRKVAQIADEILADMSPQPAGFKGKMDAAARQEAADGLRAEVDEALRKKRK